jgi:C-terminal binding protein
MSKVFITDGIDNPQIEASILGDNLGLLPSLETEVLLNWNQPITSSYLDNFPNLKSVVRCGVGYDHIDIQECNKRNITVCNDPDYCTEEVSNTAIALILNGTRRISLYDEICRISLNEWQENVQEEVTRDSDLTVGIIGCGRIGKSTLKKCTSLGFKTRFYDPYVEKGIEKELNAKREDYLGDLINSSDIVSLHCPLTEETKDIVDEKFISWMRPRSILINTARGKLTKDLSLIESSLRSGQLSFVGLDVLPDEPPKENSLISAWLRREEWLSGRLVINPHAAFYSRQSVLETRRKAAQNALKILQGEQPMNEVLPSNKLVKF